MRKRRILLLGSYPLLREGLSNLLGDAEHLTVVAPRAVEGLALAEAMSCEPDVVLIAGQNDDDTVTNALLLQLLQHYSHVPVIQIDLSAGNFVRVYTCRTLPARSADLVGVIRDLPVRD